MTARVSIRSSASVARCRRLIDAADEERHRCPPRAVDAAVEACGAVAALGRQGLGRQGLQRQGLQRQGFDDEILWLELEARAWSVLGSAQRAVGALEHAEASLVMALGFVDELERAERAEATTSTVGRRLRARLAQRAAYVRGDQHRLAEALDLVDLSVRGWRRVGDTQSRACAEVDRAVFLWRAGDREAAVEQLEAVVDVIDREENPRAALAAVHNLALYRQALADDPGTRRRALACTRRALAEHHRSSGLDRLKLAYLEASTALSLGDIDAGVEALRRVERGFGEAGAVVEQAAALLHLVEVEAARGHGADVLRHTGRLFPLLGRLRAAPAAHDAVRRVLRAVQHHELTPQLAAAARACLSLDASS